MEISKNGLYGGAAAFSYRSADGWIYYSYVGEGADGFGTYVYRYKDGVNERVGVEYFSPMRGSMSIEADGLWLTLFRKDEKALVRIPVAPGVFKVPGYPTSGASAPPPSSGGAAVIDTEARARIASLESKVGSIETKLNTESTNLWNAIIADRKRIAALEQRPNTGGVTLDQVWQKALDAQYLSITDSNSDAYKKLVELIKANAPTGTLPDNINEIIENEVTKAVTAIVRKVREALEPTT